MSASFEPRFHESYTPSRRSSATIALHGAPEDRRTTGPLVPSIVQSTTYLQAEVGACGGPTYSRVSNPTVDALEQVLGALEDAPPSVCFGTGLAAETALFLAVLQAGDHAVVGESVYGGTTRLFRELLAGLGISCTFVDASDVAAVARAITSATKLVYVETPANPTLALTDIRAVSKLAHASGALCVVDNTFLTPALQKPLELGADVCVYSTTKHIDGHAAALGGAITSKNTELLERIRWVRKCTGSIQSPVNAFLTLQGIKTLPLRMERQSAHALTIAKWLSEQDSVAWVSYPGLDSFSQRALAKLQHLGGPQGGDGGVIAFELAGGLEAGRALLKNVKLCRFVEHIGSVETLITHPATMTHVDVPREQRERVGLTDGLIRLSVGLEDVRDIISDLHQALEHAQQAQQAQNGGALCQVQ
jgi:cystathionine beta-lyase/cystathionine gamma-synthase